MKKTVASALTILALTAFLPGAAVWQITELYYGLTGEDGTEDWFELANFGDMPGDTGTLFYDDESADPTVNAALSSFTLLPGESAIFLIDATATDIPAFETIWGSGLNIGVTTGGGGLSSGGDAVYIFDSNLAGATVIDSVTFPNLGNAETAPGSYSFSTYDALTGAPSQPGVSGAFTSASFFNDNIGDPSNNVTLTGSPGIVPEPTSALLSGLGLLALLRRRR